MDPHISHWDTVLDSRAGSASVSHTPPSLCSTRQPQGSFYIEANHGDLSLLQTSSGTYLVLSQHLYYDVGGPLGSGPPHSLILLTSFPVYHLTHFHQPSWLPCRFSKNGKRVPTVRSLPWLFPLLGIQFYILPHSFKFLTMLYVSLFSISFIP